VVVDDPLDEGLDVHGQQTRDPLQPADQLTGGHRLDDAAAGIPPLQTVEKLPADRIRQAAQGELVGEQTGGRLAGPLLRVAGGTCPLLPVPPLEVRTASPEIARWLKQPRTMQVGLASSGSAVVVASHSSTVTC
jgi:hypothetical protein